MRRASSIRSWVKANSLIAFSFISFSVAGKSCHENEMTYEENNPDLLLEADMRRSIQVITGASPVINVILGER